MMQEFLDYLKSIQFRSVDPESVSNLWPSLLEVIKNPSSNIPAAVLLLAILTTVLLLVGIGIVYFLLGSNDEEEYEYVQVGVEGDAEGVQGVTADALADQASPIPTEVVVVERIKDPLRHQKRFLAFVGISLALVVVTGVTTQDRTVCTSCHNSAPHVEESAADPHGDVSCARCHEGGGLVASVTVGVPVRALHISTAVLGFDAPLGYGKVSGTACAGCHGSIADSVAEITDRALRVSHKEPIEAGAGCMDCHMLDGDEKLAKVTVGMSSCLRCHNNVDTSADCATCHTADVSQSVVAKKTRSTNNARELVPKPDCYSCHDPRPCDSCHGVRLPHPYAYVNSHMRDAAEDLWANGGATCYTCHSDNRRSCYTSNCHEITMPTHDANFNITHRSGDAGDGQCDGCHNRRGLYENTCAMCH